MIEPIRLPWIAERFLGITVPESGRLSACSYEGLHTIDLSRLPVGVETDATGREDLDRLGAFGAVLGGSGGEPLLRVGTTQIRYRFDPGAPRQRVFLRRVGEVHEVPFVTLSGDWFHATLSRCGTYLVLAEPSGIEAYRIGARA